MLPSQTLRRALRAGPRTVVASDPSRPHRLPVAAHAVVVGGGVAGCTAATVLAERGARVTMLEARAELGGRLAAWPRPMADGGEQVVEHGFHAFFRQYYNLRAWLGRIDPGLSFLRPVADYPVLARDWPPESFARLPALPPANLVALLARSASIGLTDLRQMDGRAATSLLAFDRSRTYARFDDVSAAQLLDSLRLPDRARAMLFEVFSHSFFNDEAQMSAAEMIMMFHFYFLGNPEGLLFDAPREDYRVCIWTPVARLLEGHGAEVRTGVAVDALEPGAPGRWRLHAGGTVVEADHVVLALDPTSLARLLAGGGGLGRLAERVVALGSTSPYVVARFWLDGDVGTDRAVFSGVAREPTLDSVTLYHRLEEGSAAWARRSGGSVIELHGYTAPDQIDAETLAHRMLAELGGLWPEVAALGVLDADWRLAQDAPAFGLGSDAGRPGVRTSAPGVYLAGDWVRLAFPSALMERAASAGMLAANEVLTGAGASPEPVLSVPPRGLLAGRRG